eukprot:1195717-Prorocentrum_minimum.AAC.3
MLAVGSCGVQKSTSATPGTSQRIACLLNSRLRWLGSESCPDHLVARTSQAFGSLDLYVYTSEEPFGALRFGHVFMTARTCGGRQYQNATIWRVRSSDVFGSVYEFIHTSANIKAYNPHNVGCTPRHSVNM